MISRTKILRPTGNDVTICRPSCGTTLHSYWDSMLGTSNKPDTARQAAGFLAPADQALANVTVFSSDRCRDFTSDASQYNSSSTIPSMRRDDDRIRDFATQFVPN